MRRVIDELVEDALRELADESCQRELWMAASGPEVSSFTECQSRLLDDSGLGSALDATDVVYDQRIDERLRDLARVLAGIDDSRSPQAILDDPQLGRARTMASALLEDLRRFGSDDA
ncbi:MAG: hypothetical protein ACRDY5_06095 [Acidimicrobiales bacterium]